MPSIGTINEEGVNVDLYIPRKCHATNRLIQSYDHSAIQIAIADVDANGVMNGKTTTFCISGHLRGFGDSDHAINRLSIANGIIRIKTGKPAKVDKKKVTKAPVKPREAAKGNYPPRVARWCWRGRGAGRGAGRVLAVVLAAVTASRAPRADGDKPVVPAGGARGPP